MFPDYLLHLEHHRIGGQVALRLCICGLCLSRIPAPVAPLIASLFGVQAQDIATSAKPGRSPSHGPALT